MFSQSLRHATCTPPLSHVWKLGISVFEFKEIVFEFWFWFSFVMILIFGLPWRRCLQPSKFKSQVTGVSIKKLGLDDGEPPSFFMSTVDFGEIPPFVHIKSVYIRQFWPSISTISRHLLPLFKQFSDNFTNSLMLRLNASIDSDFIECFANSMEFLSCLRGMLELEIFEQCLPQLTFCVNCRYYQQLDSLS